MNHPPEAASERAAKLRELINEYRYRYHVLDESIMSEAAADSLKHELSQLEKQYPALVTEDSPTQRVAGKALDKFKKVQHHSRMVSLADVFNETELIAWTERMKRQLPGVSEEYACDIKMDGFACSLVYIDGVLMQAVTRGDGMTGEDVTMNVRTINNVPLRLRENQKYALFLRGRTEIRGEIVMFKDEFAALNTRQAEEGKPLFKNPRNLAAGTIRQLDPQLVSMRPLHFIGYDVLRDSLDDVPTIAYGYMVMNELGVETSRQTKVVTGTDEIMEYVSELEAERDNLKFNTDGAVIKLNSRSEFETLGIVGKTPRAAVAFKFQAEEATTIIKDIVISIGRTGAATPVAVFDPVQVAGTTVRHASLHNADEIARLDARRGDTVIIFKAGDIIPQVQSVIKELRPQNSEPFDFDRELQRQYPELEFVRPEGEVVYRVKGLTGEIILKRSLEHFASKSALDIETLGERNVAALVESGLVADLADIFTLRIEDVEKLDRFAKVSAEKLITAISEKKSPSLERFIYALGIRHVGTQTAFDLAEKFENLEALKNATIDDLQGVGGVGIVVAESIAAWFADQDNLRLLEKFDSLDVKPYYIKKIGKLSGKKFVVTGTLESLSREDASEKIRSLGGVFQSTVAKDTDYLVVGGKVGASKLKKAEQYGTKIVGEEEFRGMI